MSLSLVQSRALLGLEAASVTVEVHLANGLPSFTLVGLAETEVKEARERVRSAIQNAGLEFPHNKRITVNLAPADLPKDSGRFDLPMALGILAASGQIEGARLAGHEFAGELSLSGELRPVRGALAMALALHTRGIATRLVLPATSADEAALVPGGEVYGARHLLDVVRRFLPADAQAGLEADDEGWSRAHASAQADAPAYADMADVKGHAGAKRALEIAAAGGHSLLMMGEPGSGKSMLGQRFAGLLPPMRIDEALESAAIASLGGRFSTERWMHRPTASPHHTSSAVALVGGGSPPRPGEISMAHHGVLFLDEFPEFSRAALEALREPLETGTITIARAARRAEFPARFQLVAAMNPCPCGFLGAPTKACRCTPDQVVAGQSYCALIKVVALNCSKFVHFHPFAPAHSRQRLLTQSTWGGQRDAVFQASFGRCETPMDFDKRPSDDRLRASRDRSCFCQFKKEMRMPETSVLPFFERPDLSPFLVHLTRNTVDADGYTAYENLVSILGTGEIRGSTTKSGYIKGKNSAACFMDVPLGSLKYVLNESNTAPKNPRYEAYGLIFTKTLAYKKGVRPVLYLSDSELGKMGVPADELWRVVRLEAVDGTGVNWVHEREWRCKGNFTLPKNPLAALVQTTDDARKLRKHINSDPDFFESIPGSIIPLEILCQGLPYLAES